MHSRGASVRLDNVGQRDGWSLGNVAAVSSGVHTRSGAVWNVTVAVNVHPEACSGLRYSCVDVVVVLEVDALASQLKAVKITAVEVKSLILGDFAL